jgi:hypothetical protein
MSFPFPLTGGAVGVSIGVYKKFYEKRLTDEQSFANILIKLINQIWIEVPDMESERSAQPV